MLAKLQALYPAQKDAELRIEAWLEELRGVPQWWVGKAFRLVTEQPARVFAPSINEVKFVLAQLIRAKRRREDPTYNAELAAGHDPENELRWLRREVAAALERGILPPGVPPPAAKSIRGSTDETTATAQR